jgi:AbrB family looped-hinge helix DNA binding protein
MNTTIDGAGRVVIPKPIRDAAGLKPGLELEVVLRDGCVQIEPKLAPVKIVRKGSVLVARIAGAKKMSSGNVDELVRKLREGEID